VELNLDTEEQNLLQDLELDDAEPYEGLNV
jgi:hypothetical protein